jgi:hypothetical protein
MFQRFAGLTALLLFPLVSLGAEEPDKAFLEKALRHDVLEPGQALSEVQRFVETRVPRMPEVHSVADWERKPDACGRRPFGR